MKKPKWHAKALYFVFALALIAGLMLPAAVAADPGEAGLIIFGPSYAKHGQEVTFWAHCFQDDWWNVEEADQVEWWFDDPANPGDPPDFVMPGCGQGNSVSWIYMNMGDYTITAIGHWGNITQTVTHPISIGEGLIPQEGWNILTAIDEFCVPDAYADRVLQWRIMPRAGMPGNYDTYRVYGGNVNGPPQESCIGVQSAAIGEILIAADIGHEIDPGVWEFDFTLYAVKKWGKVDFTELKWLDCEWVDGPAPVLRDCPGESQVFWYEDYTDQSVTLLNNSYDGHGVKGHWGKAILVERVIGTFMEDGELLPTLHWPADGAVVHWWVLDSNAPVHELPGYEGNAENPVCYGMPVDDLIDDINDLQEDNPSKHTFFAWGDDLSNPDLRPMTHVTTESESIDLNWDGEITDDEIGWTGNVLFACGEEAVKIVVVATYPVPGDISGPQYPVCVEICSWNFWTQELEKIPQVHWAGEKKVLEKQFGVSYGEPGRYVANFKLENPSVGVLEGLDSVYNQYNSDDSVWTSLDENGVARCIVHSQVPGKSDVILALYDCGLEPANVYGNYNANYNFRDECRLINQHGFMVYWLKVESITLSNLQGQRMDHNDGYWDPVVYSGEIWDADSTCIWDIDAWWDDDQWVGKTVVIWKQNDGDISPSSIQVRQIVDNTDWMLCVNSAWDEIPDPIALDWYYKIISPVWDASLDDIEQMLNVSQDALLRVQVKGWFMDPSNKSPRPQEWCDVNGNGIVGWPDMYDYELPAGRWVLPDDWEYIAGPWWEQDRPRWDIMCDPNDEIMSEEDGRLECFWDDDLNDWVCDWVIPPDKSEELGPYYHWDLDGFAGDPIPWPDGLAAQAPVIGPYSELDTYTPYICHPEKLDRKTIIQNGKLNWWDCPMPPAKIIYRIMDGPGFFKDVNKGHVYYDLVVRDWMPLIYSLVYTAPFYETMIPGNQYMSQLAFVNNCGYDWNSWNPAYGPYPFWDIINQPPGQEPYDEQHPTKVEVYSDNHGEAMVYLNGDWALDLEQFRVDDDPPYDAYDVPTGEVVGTTTVVAGVEYPYCRGEHPKVLSYDVEKTWTWGKEIKGYSEYVPGSDTLKRVRIFVCDRDGFPAVGERIVWKLTSSNGGLIASYLTGTNGTDILGLGYPAGESWMRLPTPAEAAAFEAKFGVPCHHAIAGITVENTLGGVCDLRIEFYEREGAIVRDVYLDYNPGGYDIFWPFAGDPPVQLYCNEDNNGWNSVAWRDQTVSPAADAVAPLGDAFVAIWHRDNLTGVWKAYKADAPAYANDLEFLIPYEVYQIQVTSDIVWNQGA